MPARRLGLRVGIQVDANRDGKVEPRRFIAHDVPVDRLQCRIDDAELLQIRVIAFGVVVEWLHQRTELVHRRLVQVDRRFFLRADERFVFLRCRLLREIALRPGNQLRPQQQIKHRRRHHLRPGHHALMRDRRRHGHRIRPVMAGQIRQVRGIAELHRRHHPGHVADIVGAGAERIDGDLRRLGAQPDRLAARGALHRAGETVVVIGPGAACRPARCWPATSPPAPYCSAAARTRRGYAGVTSVSVIIAAASAMRFRIAKFLRTFATSVSRT